MALGYLEIRETGFRGVQNFSSDFVSQHRDKIQELSNANWPKNSDGEYVITKDDPWRQEHEWDELYKELKQQK
ncbi:hypothetical protein SBF1_1120001 [Candidatus Desulfosporosinus infrequens]|uniref:Uncharacterized protein n=1 Tax=Candidatus Desulfosporosinus infrequens TaxID=2043169 RepID=A0A2U3JZ16_9FIRM|nr:hypothetical protein SBF1_1120001 [Candidatus Desulfosporosinus infrequens]